MTGEQLKALYRSNPASVTRALTKALVDFGYPVTAAYVSGEIDRLLKGEAPKGGPSMFIATWLKDGIE